MKKIKNIYKMLMVILLVTMAGCTNDFLNEIKPETSQDVNSLRYFIDDLDVLVNGSYGALFSPAGSGTFQEIIEINSDLYYAQPSEKAGWITGREGDAYMHSYAGKDYNLQAYVLQWGNFALNMANTVIQSLDLGMVDEDPKKLTDGDRVMGEAKFIRAMVNWQMTVVLGPQYHSSTVNQLSAIYRDIPILGLSDIPKGRSTVGEMYQYIIADLKDAQSKLPETYDSAIHPASYLVRVRKDAATAMLAKVYFQMNDFDSALAEIDKLLGPVSASGSVKYPLESSLTDMFKALGNNNYGPDQHKEVIYAAEGSSAQKWTLQNKWTFYRFVRPKKDSKGQTVTNAYGRLRLGNPYLSLFDKTKDKRYSEWVEQVPTGQFWQKKLALSGMNMPIFRAAEFHLMRAEILARKDQSASAVIELDQTRKRAGLDAYVFTTKAALIKEIVDERCREMMGEMVRFLDNLRLGAIDGTPVPLGEKDAEDKIYVDGVDALPWNSPKFIYDMPTNEILYNSGLN